MLERKMSKDLPKTTFRLHEVTAEAYENNWMRAPFYGGPIVAKNKVIKGPLTRYLITIEVEREADA
jgi:hypothetical protein